MKLKIENIVSIGEITPDLKLTHTDCACCYKENKVVNLTYYQDKNEYFCPVCLADGSAALHIMFYFDGTVKEYIETINSLNALL